MHLDPLVLLFLVENEGKLLMTETFLYSGRRCYAVSLGWYRICDYVSGSRTGAKLEHFSQALPLLEVV